MYVKQKESFSSFSKNSEKARSILTQIKNKNLQVLQQLKKQELEKEIPSNH